VILGPLFRRIRTFAVQQCTPDFGPHRVETESLIEPHVMAVVNSLRVQEPSSPTPQWISLRGLLQALEPLSPKL
jgi:hypothetical protein